ncbi:MAG: glycosyltransferase family 9 protein [Desulfobacterales bacterium]
MNAPATVSLLVFHQGALGDLVCLFPLIAALRRRFRPLELIAQGALARLALSEGLADKAHAVESGWTVGLFSGNPGERLQGWVSGFARLLAFSASEALLAPLRRLSRGRLVAVPPRPPAGAAVHVTDHARRRLIEAGLLEEDEPPAFRLRTVPDRLRPRVWIHPGAGSPRKRWPLERFLAVADRLRDRGKDPVFLAGPAEEDLVAPIRAAGHAVEQPGDLPALSSLLRRGAAYLGCDSGPSHLAAWCGIPSAVLFGPSDPVRWAPRGGPVRLLLPPLSCRPCFETARANCGAPECLLAVTPEEALEAVDGLLASSAGQGETGGGGAHEG